MKKFKLFIIIFALIMPCVSMACCCRKIIDYILVRQNFRNDFNEQVKKLIQEGWQPFGGGGVNRMAGSYQAMVKYEEYK
jgi:hypothetical protein